MNNKQLNETSKFLSYVLRHEPHTIGLQLDAEGWANINSLIIGAAKEGRILDQALIKTVVNNSDKKRFYHLRRWPAYSSCTGALDTGRKPPTRSERTARIPLPWYCITLS